MIRKEAQLIVNIGKEDSGKTKWNMMNLHMFSDETDRVLFLDLKNETEYLEAVNSKQFLRDKNYKGTYRVNFRGYNKIQKQRTYNICLRNFTHGVIFIGNPYAVFERIPADLIAHIICNRTFRNTVVMDLHSVKEFTHPKIMANTSFVNLFRTKEKLKSIKQIKARFDSPRVYDLFLQAEKKLEENPDINFVTINLSE